MKRNGIFILLTILSILSLTGCADLSDLTEEQSNLIAQYSAGVLLRYSDSYERRLITKEQLKKQGAEEAAPEQPETQTTPVASAVPIDTTTDEAASQKPAETPGVTVNDFFQFDGVTVTYDSYRFASKYGSTQIRADEGETLLVVTFVLKNTTGKTKKLNLMKRTDISYQADVDGEQYQPGISMLENGGLNQLSTKLKAGEKEKAVLIYRMSRDKKDAASVVLTLSDKNRTAKVTLR